MPSNKAAESPGLPTLPVRIVYTPSVFTPTCTVASSAARRLSTRCPRSLIAVLVPVLSLGLANCSSGQVIPGRSVVLAPNAALAVVKQCSRPAPPNVTGGWQPTAEQIRELESRFLRLARMEAVLCCIRGSRVSDVNKYYRQYIGLVIGAKRYIYINAFVAADGPPLGWDYQPVIMCDGGDGYWGALYDPETGLFRELAFNGLV